MSDLTYPSAHSHALSEQVRPSASAVKPAGKTAVFWCGFLLLSLSYELPLYELTGYDRLNPRLFDVVLLCAALFSGWRLRVKDAFVGSWLLVTLSFVMIGILSFAFLLPDNYRYFSLFYALKYAEILLFVLIISGFDWTRDQVVTLLKCFAVGVALAGVCGVLQKFGVLPSERYLPNGELIVLPEGAILATYGSTYFHSGVMGAMGATVALGLRMEGRMGWLWFLPIFALSTFLAIFAGSRAGLALFIFASSLILFRKSLYVILGVSLVTIIALIPGVIDYLTGESVTIQRILDTEQANSVENRISASVIGQISRLLDYHGAGVLLYGGGFYAVPMPDATGFIRYRVAYGLHNIHAFPLEQAGFLGFLTCTAFWVIALTKGWRARATVIGASGLSLVAGIFVLGWAGQIFYLGFGTENMLAAQLGVLFLLISYTAASGGSGDRAVLTPAEMFQRWRVGRAGVAAAKPPSAGDATSAASETAGPDTGAAEPAAQNQPHDSPLSRFLER